MIRSLLPYRQSPLYALESRRRGCRDQAVIGSVWLLVVLYYGAMLALIAGAILGEDALLSTFGYTVAVVLLGDPVCRLLGVLLAADAFTVERDLRTLDSLTLCPTPRRTLVGAKLLARLRPLWPPLVALVPGVAVFPSALAWLLLPQFPDHVRASAGTAFPGLAATLYLTSIYPVVGWACSMVLGVVVGTFFSLAIRSSGAAVALAYATVLVLSLGYCMVSYFGLLLGAMAGGAAAVNVHPAIGLLPALVLIVEEAFTRGVPALLLGAWMVSDFDRLAAD